MGGQGTGFFEWPSLGVTLVLDSHGVTRLAASRARLEELRRRDEWPAIVPAVVLTEALTGDHRRDFQENRLLRACDIWPVDEQLARAAAELRFQVVARRAPSAVDAIVVAMADEAGGATILSSDPSDLRALARHTTHEVRISPI
jgi:predicted nucleic acid-binding protein